MSILVSSLTALILCTNVYTTQCPQELTLDKLKEELSSKKEEKVSQTSIYDRIAESAKSQLGIYQDCTALVTNSILEATGTYFHGWPEEYASLGNWTTAPVPGDIIIYSGHVAIYVGNGQAVHGGWNGCETVLYSVNCANALIGYIHIRA